eukprot:m.187535 g.187535  ORF g.187535 m.187535 type:complete len:88 (+) comp17113_c0_seq1:166-429(+)
MPSVTEAVVRGAAVSAAGGAVVLALMALPPVASRLARLRLPDSWCLYGPIMFAKPVGVACVIATPFAASTIYWKAVEAEDKVAKVGR